MSLQAPSTRVEEFKAENRARRTTYEKAYRLKNKDRIRAQQREYYRANRERILAQFKKSYIVRRDAIRTGQNASLKRLRAELKAEVLSHYSKGTMICACCGETEPRFLSLDHIHGGGNKHRREVNARGIGLYRLLRKQGYPDGFQVLCMNCNFAKSAYSTCPHQRHEKDAA